MGRKGTVKSRSEAERIFTRVRKMRTLENMLYSYLHFSTG